MYEEEETKVESARGGRLGLPEALSLSLISFSFSSLSAFLLPFSTWKGKRFGFLSSPLYLAYQTTFKGRELERKVAREREREKLNRFWSSPLTTIPPFHPSSSFFTSSFSLALPSSPLFAQEKRVSHSRQLPGSTSSVRSMKKHGSMSFRSWSQSYITLYTLFVSTC